LLDLADQHPRIGDHAVADDAGDGRVQDAAGDELELELAMLGDNRMAGVVAALGADHHVCLLREELDPLPLSLLSPLPTADHYGHGRLLTRVREAPVCSRGMIRCEWAGDAQLMLAYHDQEWGVPARDDRTLFEFLTLEGAQAGLSWMTILRK